MEKSTFVEHGLTLYLYIPGRHFKRHNYVRGGSENSEPTTLRGGGVRIVFDVVKQYTIVSTKLRDVAILYDNVASPKDGHNEEGKSETGTVPKECIDINNARRKLNATKGALMCRYMGETMEQQCDGSEMCKMGINKD